MITTLTGTNGYMVKERLDELTSDFIAQHGDLAIERIDALEAELRPILEAVQSLPFLAAKKMVVLRSPSANKAVAEAIEQIISSTSESTELIIYEPVTDKRTVYYKTLKTKTNFEEHNQLSAGEIAGWLVKQASKAGGQLRNSDANYLIERIGLNQAIAASELEKLILFDKNVTRDNIDLLTEKSPQSKIFEMLDAAFSGQKARAIRLYEEQRAQKVEPQNILSLIAWQLNLIALAKAGQAKPASQIAAEAKLSPFPVQKAQSLAAKLADAKLRHMISEAVEIDYKSKQTPLDLDQALKTYIVSL
jgi:DNA polymerase III delta subunit